MSRMIEDRKDQRELDQGLTPPDGAKELASAARSLVETVITVRARLRRARRR